MLRACLLVLLLLLLLATVGFAADGHRVSITTTHRISESSVCRFVTNNHASGRDIFVPTKSAGEWSSGGKAFVNAAPPGVTLSDCLDAASLRFKSGSSTYLSRTPGSPGDRRTFTFSAWVKRATLGTDQRIFSVHSSTSGADSIGFTSDKLYIYTQDAVNTNIQTAAVFRDTSAWMHVVVAFDTTQAASDDRVKVYVNGVRQTSFSTNTRMSQNYQTSFNEVSRVHAIGRNAPYANEYFDGYMAEVNVVDGLQLTPSSFGQYDDVAGQWIPKAYSGSYGTNGFYLNFADPSNLGNDAANGGSNDWTANNFSTTPGATYDPMVDSPSNTLPAANVSEWGNYATLNPLPIWGGFRSTLSNGNLTAVTGANVQGGPSVGTIAIPRTGKWYFEVKIDSGIHPIVGIAKQSAVAWANGVYYWGGGSGTVYKDSDGGTAASAMAANDIIGVAVDSDVGQVTFYKNGVSQLATAYSRFGEGDFVPYVASANSGVSCQFTLNFGQQAFTYTPPTGFLALNTYNMPTPAIVTPSAYFQTTTYTGNGGYLSIGTPPQLSGGANISASLRFNDDDAAYLTRTPSAAATSSRKFTVSTWFKPGAVPPATTNYFALGNRSAGNAAVGLGLDTSSRLVVLLRDSSGGDIGQVRTVGLLRDLARWYHVVFAIDTTAASAADRIIVYVNNARQRLVTEVGPLLNGDFSGWNEQNKVGYVGANHDAGQYSDGYIADFYNIDGQALTPSDFGQYNAAGVWVPKAYSGSYGTNGFHLSFNDKSNTTAATLGADSSGNGNNWTPNNFSVTPGAGDDVLRDTPTHYTDANGDHGNFAVLNPLDRDSSQGVLSNGNLGWTTTYSDNYAPIRSSIGVSGGKWYAEYTAIAAAGIGNKTLGYITSSTEDLSSVAAGAWTLSNYYGANCEISANTMVRTEKAAGDSTIFASCASGDLISLAYDIDAGKYWVGKNGTWYNSGNPATGSNATGTFTPGGFTYYFAFEAVASSNNANRSALTVNFGQRPFAYTPPSGFKSLNTYNISATGFIPDLVWIKGRSGSTDHAIYDSQRGGSLDLATNTSTAETSTTGVLGFNAGGFNLGSLAKVNSSGATYVAWMWKKGVTPGFDVVLDSFPATFSNRVINHSLGTPPAMIIGKSRTGSFSWVVWHQGLGAVSSGRYLILNSTVAQDVHAGFYTAIASSTFTVGGHAGWTGGVASDQVFYLWSEVPGFSKFGSYIGNGSSDGPFIYTGFKPAFILIKRTDTTSHWRIMDAMRDPYSPVTHDLYPNLTSVEETGFRTWDFLSNGFKIRDSNSDSNASGGTYIYAAFAETPFKYAAGR